MPVRTLAFMPRKPLDGVTRITLCSGAATFWWRLLLVSWRKKRVKRRALAESSAGALVDLRRGRNSFFGESLSAKQPSMLCKTVGFASLFSENSFTVCLFFLLLRNRTKSDKYMSFEWLFVIRCIMCLLFQIQHTFKKCLYSTSNLVYAFSK